MTLGASITRGKMVRLATPEWEWARAEAFHRRTSISKVVTTLVAQAREQHEQALSRERLAEHRAEALDSGFNRNETPYG